MASAVLILAAPHHHPRILRYVPTQRKRQCMCIDELESRMFGASSLIVSMAAMAGGSILVSFLLVNLHRARSPMRPKNVVLLEIMIIFISFKDADLLHYLLPDVFTRWRRVWGTMEAVAWPKPPHRCLLVSFFLIFPPFSLVFVWARQKLRLV
jgi:hypothetical protein